MCDHKKRPDGTCPTCEWMDNLKRPPIDPSLFTIPMKWPRYDKELKRWV